MDVKNIGKILNQSKRRNCADSLLREPRPLCSEELQLSVLWSAKAGCTFATKWFFYQAGLLDEALPDNKGWIHKYRSSVFFAQSGYRDTIMKIFEPTMRILKFVRNPFDRAVSSYLAFCQAAFHGEKVEHAPVLNELQKCCGRPITKTRTFTFREFIGYLKTVDLAGDRCNIHFRIQTSPCERAGILPQLRLVRIEESSSTLPGLEEEFGLRHSDLHTFRQSGHHAKRSNESGFFGDHPFTRTRGVEVPKPRFFFDEHLAADVLELYREDIERYGYPSTPF